jgi:hypothetical protein
MIIYLKLFADCKRATWFIVTYFRIVASLAWYSLKAKSKLWAHANECFITRKNHAGRRKKKLKSHSIPQSFLNERLWCFCRFCVKYRQSNHNIVLRINRHPVSDTMNCCQALHCLQQPILGNIFKYLNREQWNVRDLNLLIFWFHTGKIIGLLVPHR